MHFKRELAKKLTMMVTVAVMAVLMLVLPAQPAQAGYMERAKFYGHNATYVIHGDTDGDRFGHSVAISGDTAVVGAPNETWSTITDHRSYKGAAYVYVRSGTTWSQQQQLTASDRAD